MDASQFAVYQMKCTPAYRHMRFRPYKELQDKGIRVCCRDYVEAYLGYMQPQETPEDIRHRLCKQLPRNFHGHSVSTGDVFVLNRAGTIVSYYVEKESFTVLAGFFDSGPLPLSIETSNYQIEGKNGGWNAIDSIIVEGREFFLMEHDDYGSAGACVILDENGKLAVDGVQNGFDPAVMRQLAEYLHPPGQPVGEKPLKNGMEQQPAENRIGQPPPEQPAGEQPLENSMKQQPAENRIGQHPLEQPAGEQPLENSTGRHPPGQPAGEQPLENSTGRYPPGQPAEEKPLENGGEKQPSTRAGTETGKNPAAPKKPEKPCGRRNGGKPEKRASVLEKLRRKQAEIASRGRQAAQ